MPLFWRSNNSSNNSNSNNSSNSSSNNNDDQQIRSSFAPTPYPGLRADSLSGTEASRSSSNTGVGIGVDSNPSQQLFSSINSISSSSSSYAGMPRHNMRTDPYVRSGAYTTPNMNRSATITNRSANTNTNTNTNTSNFIVRGSNVGGRTMPGLPPTTNIASNASPYAHNHNQNRNSNSNSNSNNNSNNNSNSNSNNSNSNTSSRTSGSNAASGMRPGAYSVTRSMPNGGSAVYRVTVPEGVSPGNEFTVHAGSRRVRVLCPITSRPGQALQITLPPEPITSQKKMTVAPLTQATFDGLDEDAGNDRFLRKESPGGSVKMAPEVVKVNKAALDGGGTARTYLVTIPDGVGPGDKFEARVDGQRFEVTCPANAGPGRRVRIVAPQKPAPSLDSAEPMAAPKMQVFEVVVPSGVRPNQPFTLMANNQRVLVTCPPNVYPGAKIRFQLPMPTADKNKPNVRLAYDQKNGSGWERTVRVPDMKFVWVRVDDRDNEDEKQTSKKHKSNGSEKVKALANMEGFDFGKAAYVAKLQFLEGNDARMRTGVVKLIPAQDAIVESTYVDRNYQGTQQTKTLFSYEDIERIQSQPLEKKMDWFRKSVCEELVRPWEKGHIRIVVRRGKQTLVEDSMEAILALSREDLRKRWRIEFAGEPGIEAGGLTREWFQLVTEQIFDPDFGLWLSSVNNQMSMNINPASHIINKEDYLKYFRFLGRVMGRALFDGQLIKGHMARYIYKHLLGWPVTFEDLQVQDEEYYTQLKKINTMKDISNLYLDFTVAENVLGRHEEMELIPGGGKTDVCAENLPEYLEANLKYRMLNQCKPQITELMLGFYDVIPAAALTVFDPCELELILCGLPVIDMDDWMDNTKYSGLFESKGKNSPVIQWFWEVVNGSDQEMKARLLQFVTGTSGVPSRGFSVLQGNDGNIKKFCVHGVSRKQNVFPKAHTCFNRIDLPDYNSKQELERYLGQAVSMSYVGFGME
eukprot:CAMPEP_0172383768 /NCGR_PEP_ID=MMETSP1061-20121228/1579_1 /TAXON_ID=37318 /ORGANISM="Pseudo-nitzschia pungens, Strain cf. pungens" /LENGTH=972 /DNA_ID=CAMNT_0013112101 /DNA_START=55 /DNA_END=2973 /DNA_ORIENTATION=+